MGHQFAADSCQEPQALLSIEKGKPVHCEATAVFLSSGGLPAAQILEIGLHCGMLPARHLHNVRALCFVAHMKWPVINRPLAKPLGASSSAYPSQVY